nr:endonuclease III [Geminicoccus harenae]
MSQAMTAERVEAIFARLAQNDPAPQTELVYTTPFTLLVAVVLSAQSTDVGVNKATKGLFAAAPDARSMARLSEAEVGEHIRTLGLWRNKAKNVVALAQELVERHGGEVPHDRAALEALPGVGRKTANVVLNVAFGEPTIAVDTHIFRVANRTGLAPGKTVEKVEQGLLEVVPEQYRMGAHHWLILHGRYVCKARRPECWRCVIEPWCLYPDKQLYSKRPTGPAGVSSAEDRRRSA